MSYLNGAGGDDRPNIHRASERPDLTAMEDELSRAIGDGLDFYGRNETAINARYCWWEGQSPDGRKWGTLDRPAFPWAGASDTRVRAIDMIVNEKVDLLLTALLRMNVQAVPTKAGDSDWASRMSALLRWYLANQMSDEADAEIELLANYLMTFGSGVLSIGWLQTLAYEMHTVRLEDMKNAALRVGGQELLGRLASLIFDPARMPEVIPVVKQFSQFLSNREAQKVIEALREKAEATFPRPYVSQARPTLCALMTYQDVFFPCDTDRLQRARWIAQREMLNEPELMEKAEGREGWDADFVKNVREYDGKLYHSEALSGRLSDRLSDLGGIWLNSTLATEGRFEVWHFYTRASYRGVPAIFHTVMHPQCRDRYGVHEILPYQHGQYPFVEFVRERTARTILSSRGLPEVLMTHQQEMKVQRDSRVDRASVTTMPPIKEKLKVGQQKRTYGPGIVVPVSKMDDVEPMIFGAPDTTSREVEMATRHDINEYVGRPGEGVDPALVVNASQALVTRWLRRWQCAGKQVLALAQQYTPEQTIGRVVGLIQKPLQISRETIAGEFDLILSFDARFANAEFVFSLMERFQKYVFPVDTNAIVNRDAVIRYVMSSVDPTLADLAVRDSESAAAAETEDELANWALMFAGAEPPMKIDGQNHRARLAVLQQTIQRNPVLQQMLAQRPDVQEILTRRTEFLMQQVQQQQNKMIGIYGTNPAPGSAGGPQLGAMPTEGVGA